MEAARDHGSVLMPPPKSVRSIHDVQIGKVVGRIYDSHGCCNTSNKPLVVSVKTIVPGRLWNIHVSFTAPTGPYVDIILDADVLGDKKRDGRLFATGLLYSDEASSYLLDEYGRPFYDSENKPMRRAPMVVSGPFEGARFDESDWQPHIRVDCAALLSFWLDIAVTFVWNINEKE